MDELKILIVDDETANLQKLRRTFVNRFPVLAASSGREALELMQKHDRIAVIIADQRMPDMTGVDLLRHSMKLLPDAIRIILTGYTDVDVLMEAINSCKVYRYIVKPWDPPDLLITVQRGLEAYSMALENAQFRKELIRRERLARELEIASEIQRYILPARAPEIEGYEIAVEYHPAREVGGDLYDFAVSREDDTFQIVIGDVSGKSVAAALYGAVFSGKLGMLFAAGLSPGKMLERANRSLITRYPAKNYVAVACVSIERRSGKCILANSGMPFPYLVRNGEVSRLNAAGVPLGLLEESVYDELSFVLEKGDMLVMASDGVQDAMDPDDRMYEEQRFMEVLRRHADRDVAMLTKELVRDIADFTRNGDLHDDVTIVALHRSL
jgi:sigma-B regulation protein RsbU (phosphoserine phosphatase)